MPDLPDQLSSSLVASGLFSADELAAFWSSLPPPLPEDRETFVRSLLERKKLTTFQAEELLSGAVTPLVLGDYILLDRIGAGGMGQVFQARHRHMERIVAIKLLPPALTKNAEAVQRFQREVKAAAKLVHPNIVQAYDASVLRGVWYLVMEFVGGKDLAAIVEEAGPLPIHDAVEAVRQAARGLAYAHANGVVHRDIKPANLLCDPRGTIKILDMGLARMDDGSAVKEGLTQSGQVMGTLDFMAPEQAFDTHTADARADIYSLGCTLYRLLTARNMYGGDTLVKKLLAHRDSPIPSLAAACPEALGELVRIFERMVAKKPEDRFQTMTEVDAALQAWEQTAGGSAGGAGGSSFKSIAGTKPASATAVTATFAHPKAPTEEAGISPTVSLSGSQSTTDPVSERSLQVAKEQSQPRATAEDRTPRRKLLAAVIGGGVLCALIAGGMWLTVGEKEESDVARVIVPVQGSEEVPKNPEPKPAETAPAAPPLAKAPFTAAEAKAHQQAWADYLGVKLETTNSVGAKMVLIPPGEFLMGSSDEDVALALKIAEEADLDPDGVRRIQDKCPQHRVRITQPFRLGMHEVTTGQFAKFIEQSGYKTQAEEFGGNSNITNGDDPRINPANMKLNWRTPGYEVGENSPVTQVNWNEAVAFCNWLSAQENLETSYVRDGNSWMLAAQPQGYRLPTEAEWEYACRAGTSTQYSFGDDWKEHGKFGWLNRNAGGRPHAGGLLPANPFGLYDMHGNVWEWCDDWYDGKWYARSPSDDPRGPLRGSHRVTRGGSWSRTPAYCRSSCRYTNSGTPADRGHDRGFRVALSGAAVELRSAPPAAAPPQRDLALEFEGTGEVLTPVKFDGSGPISFEAWVSVTTEQSFYAMRAYDPAGSEILSISGNWADRQLWTCGFANTAASKANASYVTGRKVVRDQLIHVAGVYDGLKLSFFMDGKKVGERVLSGQVTDGKVITFRVAGPRSFAGLLNETRFSKSVRYTEDFTPKTRWEPDDDTLALYHFDEGAGNVAEDSSGNHLHAKIVNGQWVHHNGAPLDADPKTWLEEAPDRRAGTALLPYAQLTVRIAGERRAVDRGGVLPAKPFDLVGITVQDDIEGGLPKTFVGDTFLPTIESLRSLEAISDPRQKLRKASGGNAERFVSSLAANAGARNITQLTLGDELPTPGLVSALHQLPRLSSVRFAYGTDAEMEGLSKLPPTVTSLTLLNFGDPGGRGDVVTERGQTALAALPLERLEFQHNGPAINSRLFELLAESKTLKALSFASVDLTDKQVEELAVLAACPTLRSLRLKTQSRESLAKLSAALPFVRIESYHAPILPKIEKVAPPVGETVDLLSRIEPWTHSRNGVWEIRDGALHSPLGDHVSLEFPIEAAASYRIEAEVERCSGNNGIEFGIVVGAKGEGRVVVEGYGESLSGIDAIDGKYLKEQAKVRTGAIFEKGKSSRIAILVTPQRVVVTRDGVAFVEWSGESSAITDNHERTRASLKTSRRSLFVDSCDSRFRISKLTYTALPAE